MNLFMSKFRFEPLPISGAARLLRLPVGDERGWLQRLFCADELRAAGWGSGIAQINQSYTALRGTVRGMHFQHTPVAEAKLVSCLRGRIWDVVVDLRTESPTYLQWHAEELSPENKTSLLIPERCAHGFQTLTEDVELLYLHSAMYSPENEAGLCPTDPALGIGWPLAITQISRRDALHPPIDKNFTGCL